MSDDDPNLAEPDSPATSQPTSPAANQFSIRALLIATAVIAGLCCIFLTLPAWVGRVFLLITMLLSMPTILAALIYGRGLTRAFAVGATPPLAIIFLWFSGIPDGVPFFEWTWIDEFEFKIFFVVLTFVVVGSGFVAQAVRWWCLRSAN